MVSTFISKHVQRETVKLRKKKNIETTTRWVVTIVITWIYFHPQHNGLNFWAGWWVGTTLHLGSFIQDNKNHSQHLGPLSGIFQGPPRTWDLIQLIQLID